MTKKDKKQWLLETAYERALFDNAHLHFDDIMQDPDLKEKFREFCLLMHQKMMEKWGMFKGNHKNGKKKKIGF